MKNPLVTIKGTIISGFVITGVAIVVIRIFSSIN